MSGSSLDGLDIAIATFASRDTYDVVFNKHCALPSQLASELNKAASYNIKDYLELESKFTDFIAKELQNITNQYQDINLIAIHGHTVHHDPDSGYSCQMVNAGRLASLTGLDVLADFRNQDIGLGGQGAPLAPIVEHLLGSQAAYLNLGGIANISLHKSGSIVGYDVSPCNQLFNHFAKLNGLEYDDKGLLGRKGAIDQNLLNQWSALPYFQVDAPKSMDNQWLVHNFISTLEDDKSEDQCHTAYQFVSHQIAKSVINNLSEGDRVMCTGGGSYNDYLIQLIQDKIKSKSIQLVFPPKELIDYKEAILMSYMGYLYLNNKPNTLSSVTGASRSASVGGYYKAPPHE